MPTNTEREKLVEIINGFVDESLKQKGIIAWNSDPGQTGKLADALLAAGFGDVRNVMTIDAAGDAIRELYAPQPLLREIKQLHTDLAAVRKERDELKELICELTFQSCSVDDGYRWRHT